ncbi:hypothetical protein [Mesorhizobium sp. INR15]|uniref:hypothetical protein n=1 Tax=Mesorhizobium sp. INR15 TaxID=2654248 RepID=UPI00189643BF|nr:hypothetical protein [Mesorhizobium sp. INR15]QPC91904.1 hypothetical protein GA829_15650 [Mesorhizobium sp. INR15]
MDITNYSDPQELGRRQQMAAARRQRESERLAFFARVVEAQRRAGELRDWISAYARSASDNAHSELQRMVGWAEAQLKELDHFLDAERISSTLRERGLFPEVDPIHDPLGEPLRHHIWGHSGAVRHCNEV